MTSSCVYSNRLRPAVWATAWAVLLVAGPPVAAQNEPPIVHDTKAVVLQGPYLSSLSETGATVAWVTDTPCHVKVVYGGGEDLDREAANAVHGLLPIGTVHAVRIAVLGVDRSVAATHTIRARK